MSQTITEQKQMFGTTTDVIMEQYEKMAKIGMYGNRTETASFMAVSMMSDAQEEIAHGMTEQARQTLNKAKYLLMMAS